MIAAGRVAHLVVPALALASPVFGQAEPSAEPDGSACGGRAGLYEVDKGPKVWVTRRGSMEQDNPLRPLSRDHLVVLQVVVNGRIATAYGPDFDNLLQGGPPQQLQSQAASPISWDREGAGFPERIRVVAADGTVLLGPLRFSECADAPQAKAVATSPTRAEGKAGSARTGRSGETKRPGEAGRDTSRLPQGAIQGLTLPPAAAD